MVIPNELKFSDGSPVRADFNRVMTTCFNGASSISQNGGMASLDKEGLEEIDMLIDYYMENASILRKTMIDLGFKVYGGTDAPYIWVDFGAGKSSWDIFSEILQKAEVVTVPGAGNQPNHNPYQSTHTHTPSTPQELFFLSPLQGSPTVVADLV